jgi:hypothetical protein
MDTFYLEDYIGGKTNTGNVPNMSFERLCEAIKDDFIQEWDRDGEDAHATLELQKKAIIGYSNEKRGVAGFNETPAFTPWDLII